MGVQADEHRPVTGHGDVLGEAACGPAGDDPARPRCPGAPSQPGKSGLPVAFDGEQYTIAEIETAAGFPIIDRSSTPLSPTDAGRDFIHKAQQIL
jgi:hypothetical protein